MHFPHPYYYTQIYDLSENLSLSIEYSFSGAFSTPYKYDLATHTVTVRRTGLIGDVMALWDMKESCVTASVTSDTDLFNRMQR